MPPKCKFNRDEIIKAGLELTRDKGIEAVTARGLGERLHSSSKPIFTIFNNMEEVQFEVKKAAKGLYAQYIKEGLNMPLAFKGVGIQYILFSIKEPKLFQLLFMSEQEHKPSVSMVLPLIDDSYELILKSVEDGYNLNRDDALNLYKHLWIYTHGIASLCATNMCLFTSSEINEMMSEVCKSLLKEIKSKDI